METGIEKQQRFKKELVDLLLKYDAELQLEDFGRGYNSNEKIVVDFGWDKEIGIIPQLVIGRYENGK